MQMGSERVQLQLPIIDFSLLDPTNSGSAAWCAARDEVMQALEAYGCFEAVYSKVTPELREALVGLQAMGELFSLPLEAKLRNTSELPFQGYIGQTHIMAYESLCVGDADSLEGAEGFTLLMWPEGNPSFRDTVLTYAKHLKNIEMMVERMVLQNFGIEKYYDKHMEAVTYGLRLSEYGVPFDQECKLAMGPHLDPNLITIICQHKIEGLEVQTSDGDWIHVVPSLNSFTVLIGEAFGAWTNGRLLPPYHGVRITSNVKRHSALFASRLRDSYILQSPEELIDEEHPPLYKPYAYDDYVRFRFSEEGMKAKNAMKAFCGASEVEQ